MLSLDYQLFQKINNLAGKSKTCDFFFIIATRFVIWFLGFVALWLASNNFFSEGRILFFNIIFSVIIIILINHLIGFFCFRPRPYIRHEKVNKLFHFLITKKSFPSDHAAIAFALATSVYLYQPYLGIIFFLLAFWVAVSRVYVGVHYPLDIVVGGILGTIISFIIENLLTL